MASVKKALIFGFLVWLIPFAIAFAIFPIRESNRIMFESIMPVAVAGLGLIWFGISLIIDLFMFSAGPMKMSFGDYLADIGIVYLMIPIITIGFAGSLCGRSLRE